MALAWAHEEFSRRSRTRAKGSQGRERAPVDARQGDAGRGRALVGFPRERAPVRKAPGRLGRLQKGSPKVLEQGLVRFQEL